MEVTIFVVVVIILLLVFLLAQDSKKDTTSEKVGDAVSSLADMAAGSVSKLARDLTEPASKKKIRKAKEKIAWKNYNILHNYSKIYLDSVIDDENFLIIDDEFANALDTLGLDHDKWKKVAKDFFYMGVINICSHYEVNNEIKKNTKYDRQRLIDNIDDQGYDTDLFGNKFKHQIIDALKNFNIDVDDFVEYGDTVIDMYEITSNKDYEDYGLMIFNN